MAIKNLLSECVDRFERNNLKVGNFLNECYSEKTSNKANLVSINEMNAKRMLDRHTADGYVIISPCRGGADFGLDPDGHESEKEYDELNHINKERVKKLVEILKSSEWSYTPMYGGYIENRGTDKEKHVFERSFVVYNHRKDGSVGNFADLRQFAVKMAQMFNQDSVLVQEPNGKPQYIKQDNSVDFGFDGDVVFNDVLQDYYSDFDKTTNNPPYYTNKEKKEKTIRADSRPTRFSFVECYINPAPQCYGERISRARMGEIFL